MPATSKTIFKLGAFVYVAACLGVALLFGCVTLTYPMITDSETANPDGSYRGPFVVVTKNAHVEETTQTSQTIGSRRIEHLTFIDQDKRGHHRLAGYAFELAVGTNQFHSDSFCNSNFVRASQGCQWLTNVYRPSPVFITPPCSFTAPGVTLDLDCLGDFSAIGLCPSGSAAREGECGEHASPFLVDRGGGDRYRLPGRMSVSELQALLDAGVEDSRGILNYSINQATTSLVFENGTGTFTPQIFGTYQVPFNMRKGMVDLDLSGSHHARNLTQLADMIEEHGQSGWTYTITFNGVTRSNEIAFLSAEHYRNLAVTNY